MTFNELGLTYELQEGLDAMRFETATPIQEEAIPVILDGKDLIACAQTGTGKTAAFILPILDDLVRNPSSKTHTIVLVPTRELAIQIDRQLEGFAYFTGVSSLPIYGGRDGASFVQEKKSLTSGANIIVATPGRLIAHLNMGYVKLKDLQCLILDEADRMLDMGFVNDIMKIIHYLPKERQTLMFSATMPPKIRKFAKEILNNPEQISFAVSKPAENVLQGVYHARDELKLPLLKHLLTKESNRDKLVIIFSSTKKNVKAITSSLKSAGLPAGDIHSDLDQQQREETLRQFKAGNTKILVATDILARGIDVKGIHLVVNFDVPGDAEDYIHRIGRTARADADGVALTLVNRRDKRKMQSIERLMESKVQVIPLPDFLLEEAKNLPPEETHARGGGRGRGRNRGGGGRGRGGHSRGGSNRGGSNRGGKSRRGGRGGNRSGRGKS